jgi:acyl-CoA dehydrogenase
MHAFDKELAGYTHPALAVIRRALAEGVAALNEATDWLLETYPYNALAAGAGAVPYLKLWGIVAGGWQMARAAHVAKARLDGGEDFDFYGGKIGTARFYAEHILPQAQGYKAAVVNGSASVLALEEAQF